MSETDYGGKSTSAFRALDYCGAGSVNIGPMTKILRNLTSLGQRSGRLRPAPVKQSHASAHFGRLRTLGQVWPALANFSKQWYSIPATFRIIAKHILPTHVRSLLVLRWSGMLH